MKASTHTNIQKALSLHKLCTAHLGEEARNAKHASQLPRFTLSLMQAADASKNPLAALKKLTVADDISVARQFTDAVLTALLASAVPLPAHEQIFAFEAMKAAQDTAEHRHRQGVHYTPIAVVDALLATTLPPLESASQILSLRICDPAMGCGIFLLRAMRTLSAALLDALPEQSDDRRLKQMLEAQSPALRLAWAKRLVAQYCLFGADIDAETVRSARLVLASACAVPGQAPLNLSTNLMVGDALVGLTPEMAITNAWARFKQTRVKGAHMLSCMAQQVLGDEFVRERLGLPQNHLLTPVHWSLGLPQVFNGPNGGFDVVVGNPPFGNAINTETGAEAHYRDWWKQTAPDLAQGAFDRANCFVGLSARLLRDQGRYALVLPRALLSGGRANTALHSSLNQTAAPTDIFVLDDPKLFDGANVFTCGLAGTKNGYDRFVTIHANLSHQMTKVSFDATVPWWTLAARAQTAGTTDVPPGFESLSAQHVIRAGCATDTAYQLAETVHDTEHGEGLKLITTGLIDRYMQGWGLGTVRFLKRRFDFPRWPHDQNTSNTISKQIERQAQPKILIGGLTKTLEAYLDKTGECGGVVSTWMVRPKVPHPQVYMQRLEAVLNSWIVSWRYHQAYGAQQSPWGGMTIKKAGLAEIEVPSKFLTCRDTAKTDLTNPWLRCPNADQSQLTQCAVTLVKRLNDARSQHDYAQMYALDADLQPYLARLYGCTQPEFEHIATWFEARDRQRRPMTTYGAPPDLDLNSVLNPRIDEARTEQ